MISHNFFVSAPPIFLVEPSNQKVAEGAPASLDCIAAGNPTPTLFWIKESSPGILLPATTHGHVAVTPQGTLNIGECIFTSVMRRYLSRFFWHSKTSKHEKSFWLDFKKKNCKENFCIHSQMTSLTYVSSFCNGST